MAEALPLSVACDLVSIRVADERRCLHLVGATGWPPDALRAHCAKPLGLREARQLRSKDLRAAYFRALGVRWHIAEWLGEDPPAGVLVVAGRTGRRPTAAETALVQNTGRTLAARLAGVPRRGPTLKRLSKALSRSSVSDEPRAPALSEISPRERVVLGLYADGLSTREVAATLVISPATVKTHVKNALRTLDLHAREEAAELVRTGRLRQFL